MGEPRPVALVDANNFYVSCERVFDARLKGVPVLVLSNNDGCAIARSEEVKALGVRMGEPAFKLRGLIARHKIRVFSSNYALYGDMSRRVNEVLSTFSPEVEPYSIDETFLDLGGLPCRDLWAVPVHGYETPLCAYAAMGIRPSWSARTWAGVR